ncbi:Glutathione S-transferase, N-terminal [Penicillium camemberti]|uniref:Glutathione S-transferase, N-terminal n=1 Tax=Penicillium camemberti (strain FM 013) TaxID=1429867 RepID=A0A0G4PN85_PENC3|nr:Glutathione S-transferase, N-terminal [Penicillium camemberti]
MPAHPDSNLYPEASGPAKVLVDQHRAEQPLKLYAGWFCPYSNVSGSPSKRKISHTNISRSTHTTSQNHYSH